MAENLWNLLCTQNFYKHKISDVVERGHEIETFLVIQINHFNRIIGFDL